MRTAEVIVALDLPTGGHARSLLNQLPELRWAKIGPMLFVREGPPLIRELRDRGVRVFLDLKWHDIPSAVGGAVRATEALGVDLVTVHALGGAEMLGAAVEAASEMRIAAVSMLTSYSSKGYGEALGRSGMVDLRDEALRLARVAVEVGVHGMVSSPEEVSAIQDTLGAERWIIVPGIRPRGAPDDDQRRTAEPLAAVRAGATHLVVGRPITRAECPRTVYEEICEEVS